MKPAGVFDLFREANSNGKSKSSSRIMLWTSFVLAIFFLYLALRGLDWEAFASSITGANYSYLPFICIWGSFSQFVRAIRWRVLLTAEKDIRPQNVFWANMAGYLGNNILPARAGELVRAVYLGKANDIPVSFALATGLVERFMDLLALIILGSVSLALAGIFSAQLETALRVISVIGLLGLVGILLVPHVGNRLLALIPPLPGIKPSLREKIDGVVQQFLRGVAVFHQPWRAATFILFTCLIWTIDGIGTIILARALHLHLGLIQSFVLLSGLGLSSAIPSTPGYVGIYQFVAVIVLKPFGISNANSLAFIIILQVLNFLIIAFWGTISMWVARKTVFGRTISPNKLGK